MVCFTCRIVCSKLIARLRYFANYLRGPTNFLRLLNRVWNSMRRRFLVSLSDLLNGALKQNRDPIRSTKHQFPTSSSGILLSCTKLKRPRLWEIGFHWSIDCVRRSSIICHSQCSYSKIMPVIYLVFVNYAHFSEEKKQKLCPYFFFEFG